MGAPETGLEAAEQSTAESLLTAFRTIKPAERARHASVLTHWTVRSGTAGSKGSRPRPASFPQQGGKVNVGDRNAFPEEGRLAAMFLVIRIHNPPKFTE